MKLSTINAPSHQELRKLGGELDWARASVVRSAKLLAGDPANELFLEDLRLAMKNWSKAKIQYNLCERELGTMERTRNIVNGVRLVYMENTECGCPKWGPYLKTKLLPTQTYHVGKCWDNKLSAI